MNVLITGAEGFIGKNLISVLQTDTNVRILTHTKSDNNDSLKKKLMICDIVVHLAGVNRPKDISEHEKVNYNLTKKITDYLEGINKQCDIIFTSSIQANLNNPYGRSKKAAEEELFKYKDKTGSNIYIYQLPNLFGKWSKPNYNSVVSTFCYNISRDIPIEIHDQNKEIELLYIDDLILNIIKLIHMRPIYESKYYPNPKTYKVTLSYIADLVNSFKGNRMNLKIPKTSDDFIKKIYSTYLSYMPVDDFKYALNMKEDDRGSFTEFIKISEYGQISINVSKVGVIKGNHWHKTKVEKFLVVRGKAQITFKDIYDNEIVDYYVDDNKLEIVDIPPGYSHSIKNIGNEDLVTVIWANEIYSNEDPDTYR